MSLSTSMSTFAVARPKVLAAIDLLRPVSQTGQENMSAIPVIDFGLAASAPGAVAGELLQACADWGFFYIRNHTIPQAAIDGVFDLERRFFAQSIDQKTTVPYVPSRNAGFKPASSHRPNGKLGDPREAFSINKWPSPTHQAHTLLPPVLEDARDQIASFQAAVHDVAMRLLELIAVALDLPADQFTSQHDRSKENFDNFELMHYPPVVSPAPSSTVPAFRISPHTDWGTLTLLFQQSIGGLQVRPPSYTSPTPDLAHEVWTSAPAHNDMILVNIADMLEFWTAGRLKSTWHRVVPTAEHGNVDRYTFAYFLHPDKDAVLRPIERLKREEGGEWIPRYQGLGRSAEEHIHTRIAGEYGVAADEKGSAAVSVVG